MKQTLLTDDSFQVDEGRCRVPSELSSPWVKHLASTLAVVMPLNLPEPVLPGLEHCLRTKLQE